MLSAHFLLIWIVSSGVGGIRAGAGMLLGNNAARTDRSACGRIAGFKMRSVTWVCMSLPWGLVSSFSRPIPGISIGSQSCGEIERSVNLETQQKDQGNFDRANAQKDERVAQSWLKDCGRLHWVTRSNAAANEGQRIGGGDEECSTAGGGRGELGQPLTSCATRRCTQRVCVVLYRTRTRWEECTKRSLKPITWL